MQYGPAELFPRAWELPAGPPSDDALLVTCAYLLDRASPWVMQSLFLAAIGDARDKKASALETFAYRYPEGESAHERFVVHRTVFPRDFLSDFGFETVRAQGRVELARLELGGLQPVAEGRGPRSFGSSRTRSRRRRRRCLRGPRRRGKAARLPPTSADSHYDEVGEEVGSTESGRAAMRGSKSWRTDQRPRRGERAAPKSWQPRRLSRRRCRHRRRRPRR